MSDSTVPEACPEDLKLIVAWRLGDNGALDGRLDAVNVSDHRVRLTGKPGLTALASRRPCSGQVVVTWAACRAEVTVDGPAQPSRHGPATNLYTSWFALVE